MGNLLGGGARNGKLAGKYYDNATTNSGSKKRFNVSMFEITCVQARDYLEDSFYKARSNFFRYESALISLLLYEERNAKNEIEVLEIITYEIAKMHCINAIQQFLETLKDNSRLVLNSKGDIQALSSFRPMIFSLFALEGKGLLEPQTLQQLREYIEDFFTNLHEGKHKLDQRVENYIERESYFSLEKYTKYLSNLCKRHRLSLENVVALHQQLYDYTKNSTFRLKYPERHHTFKSSGYNSAAQPSSTPMGRKDSDISEAVVSILPSLKDSPLIDFDCENGYDVVFNTSSLRKMVRTQSTMAQMPYQNDTFTGLAKKNYGQSSQANSYRRSKYSKESLGTGGSLGQGIHSNSYHNNSITHYQQPNYMEYMKQKAQLPKVLAAADGSDYRKSYTAVQYQDSVDAEIAYKYYYKANEQQEYLYQGITTTLPPYAFLDDSFLSESVREARYNKSNRSMPSRHGDSTDQRRYSEHRAVFFHFCGCE